MYYFISFSFSSSSPPLPIVCLTPAVRNGDLVRFSEVLEMFTPQFQLEKTFTLIVRLRHNVIKTGIRTISLSYSRISLRDIADKLQLDNPIDAEYIIAKVGCLLQLYMYVLYSRMSRTTSVVCACMLFWVKYRKGSVDFEQIICTSCNCPIHTCTCSNFVVCTVLAQICNASLSTMYMCTWLNT